MDETLGPQITFWALAALTVGSGILSATTKKIVNAAFLLMATFFGVAGIYAVLGSDFLAITQAVVYIGGILILLVFGVLLTDRVPDEYRVEKKPPYLTAGLAAGATFLALAWACASTEWPGIGRRALTDTTEGTVEQIGIALLGDYLIPFEFASILLLVVLVGSARMARGGTR